MAIRLPDLADLQQVTDLITGGGVDYRQLTNEQRLAILKLAIQADTNESLAFITNNLNVINDTLDNLPLAVAELEPFMTLAAKIAGMDTSLNNMSVDLDAIGDWFNRSTPLDIYALKGN